MTGFSLPTPSFEVPDEFESTGPLYTTDDEFLICWKRRHPAKNWSSNSRHHYMTVANQRKAWRAQAHEASEMMRERSGLWYVRVSIPFFRGGRRDPSNFTGTVGKSIVDGLVDSGVWVDDTPDFVQMGDPICRVVKKSAGPMVGVHAWRVSDD